jgi:hypothetical protein
MANDVSTQPQEESNTRDTRTPKQLWTHPSTITSFLILAFTILLIAANVLGFDKGDTLNNLARIEYARGLITYLFAVGTIGAIISVILAILLGQESIDEKIKRAKDILTILIGLFGTIIGYYFGAQIPQSIGNGAPVLQITAPITSPTLTSGQLLNVSTRLTGGVPPYSYWIVVNSQTVRGTTDSQIMESFAVTPTTDSLIVSLFVKDDRGDARVDETAILVQKP